MTETESATSSSSALKNETDRPPTQNRVVEGVSSTNRAFVSCQSRPSVSSRRARSLHKGSHTCRIPIVHNPAYPGHNLRYVLLVVGTSCAFPPNLIMVASLQESDPPYAHLTITTNSGASKERSHIVKRFQIVATNQRDLRV